jgi:hypothetical protein
LNSIRDDIASFFFSSLSSDTKILPSWLALEILTVIDLKSKTPQLALAVG